MNKCIPFLPQPANALLFPIEFNLHFQLKFAQCRFIYKFMCRISLCRIANQMHAIQSLYLTINIIHDYLTLILQIYWILIKLYYWLTKALQEKELYNYSLTYVPSPQKSNKQSPHTDLNSYRDRVWAHDSFVYSIVHINNCYLLLFESFPFL